LAQNLAQEVLKTEAQKEQLEADKINLLENIKLEEMRLNERQRAAEEEQIALLQREKEANIELQKKMIEIRETEKLTAQEREIIEMKERKFIQISEMKEKEIQRRRENIQRLYQKQVMLADKNRELIENHVRMQQEILKFKEELQKPTAFDIEFERLIGSKRKVIIERSIKNSDRSTAGASSNENSIETIGEATYLA